MQMAIDVAGFTPSEADQLRQAMGSKRSRARMEKLRERLFEGMAERGITGDIAEEMFVKMAAFANYGFPESHTVSFAYLVYASSWIKYHEPAAFCAALLNAQPMGFWSPHSLVQDARRHGVVTRTPDLNASLAVGDARAVTRSRTRVRRCGSGIGSVRGIGDELAEGDRGRARRARLVSQSSRTSPAGCRRSTSPSWRRWRPPGAFTRVLRARAARGAVGRRSGVAVAARSAGGRGHRRRRAAAAGHGPGRDGRRRPVGDRCRAERPSDAVPARRSSTALGVVTAVGLWQCEPQTQVLVAGVVTHRQRPMTAQGTTFMNLEDETGLMNIVCSKGCWARYRRIAREAPALLIRGTLERSEGVINIVAEQMTPLHLPSNAVTTSRDFPGDGRAVGAGDRAS